MHKSSLLILLLSLICILSCNKNKDDAIKNISKDEARNIVNKYPIEDKSINKIICTWDNKVKNNTIQGTLIEQFGATSTYIGENTITNEIDINRIKGKDIIKFNLNKDTFDNYFFNDSFSYQYINNEYIKVTYINEITNRYWLYNSLGYINEVSISDKSNNPEVDYIVKDVFY